MGKNIIFLIIIISVAILLLSISLPLYLVLNKKKLPETYDCYLLSIFWTPTSCQTKNKDNFQCYQKIKELGIEKYFTIHGLWPSTLKGIIPPACNEGFENKTVQPDFDSNPKYNDKIEHYWPGLYNGNKNLWKHEYNKHGYCYMKRNYLNFVDDYKIYFDKTIELYEAGFRNLMVDILPDCKGVYNISKSKFRNLLKSSKLNLSNEKTYCLMCDESTNFLTEIYFIYDMNFKPTIQQIHQENCPEIFYFNFTDETKLAVWEKYDYYAFAVQYSPNVCVWRGDNCFKILKNKTDYKVGIHGLWPSYKSGIIPQQCNLGEDIQIEVDSDREYFDNFILKYWYSLYNTDDYFLTHEYNTHGYCYNKYINESTDNFTIYLNKTLEIFHRYNFASMFDTLINGLEERKYLMNKTDILNELEKKYPKNSFVLRCYTEKKEIYLNEIHFKLNKSNFNLIEDAKLTDTCRTEKIWINVIKNE